MKLTKTKNVKGAIFYRDINEGKLCLENAMEKKTDNTEDVINEKLLITSLVGRIIKTEDKNKLKKQKNETNKDRLTDFLTKLIEEDNHDLPILTLPEKINGKIRHIRDNFSSYGKNLTLHEKNTTEDNKKLVDLLEKHYLKNKNIDKELEKWHTELNERIKYKQDRLIKSIHNNKIALLNKSDSAEKNSKQLWLQFLVLNDMDYILNDYENNLYNYKVLYKKLNDIANKNSKPEKFRILGKKIYDAVKEYNKKCKITKYDKNIKNYFKFCLDMIKKYYNENNEIYKDDENLKAHLSFYLNVEKKYNPKWYKDNKDNKDDKDLKICLHFYLNFYLNEVQAYYRHYFIGTFVQHQKTISPKNNKRLQKLLGHAEAGKKSYPAEWVRHHIINKINAMLIQNGKLLCYKEQGEKSGAISPNGFKATSDKLSSIQIEESFKKQIFLAITWAINRLNYFFKYGSNNDDNLSNINGANKSDTDIILEFNEGKSLRYYYKNKQKTFFINLHDSQDDQKIFREKLCATFSMNKNDFPELTDLLDILDAAKNSISYLRNNLFHPKEKDLFSDKRITEQKKTLTEREKAVIDKINNLLQQDINRIKLCFEKQLRSSSIAEVYRADLLKEVFSKCNLQFKLYPRRYEFVPSFKAMYKRGANLTEEQEAKEKTERKKKTKDIKKNNWLKNKPAFTKNDSAAIKVHLKKWQAYRNLLQLIYQYSFLPALSGQQALPEVLSLLEKASNDIIKRNNPASENNSKHGPEYNSKQTYSAYNEIHAFNGIDFAKYMADLQREQSLKASEQHDEAGKQDKKNYYVRFVQDLFAEAFNSYLDKYLVKQKHELQQALQTETSLFSKDVVDDTLYKIFNEEQKLKRASDLDPNKAINIFFYPFLKLLERRELSKLQQQIIRYRTSVGNSNTENAAQQAEQLENLLALLIFTFPDQTKIDETYDTMMQKHFNIFLDRDRTDYKGVFVQNDNKTAIKQKSMLALMRTGALPLYKEMFKGEGKTINRDYYKISQSDYDKYKEWIGMGESKDTNTDHGICPIEEQQIRLAKLHEKLCKKSKSTDRVQTYIGEYRECLKKITKYNNLRRKLTFDLLYGIYIIHTDILSRLISFTTDWERDMHFLLRGLLALQEKNDTSLLMINSIDEIDYIFNYNSKPNTSTFTKEFIDAIEAFKEKKNMKKRKLTLTSKFTILVTLEKENDGILNKLLMDNCSCQLKDIINVRNSLAHLNHMTQRFIDTGNGRVYQNNLINIMSRLTKLLNYDLKRKNAVTRVIKEILQKHHVLLRLTKKNNCYTEIELESEQINHLKNLKLSKQDKITCPVRDSIFLQCIARLLTFSYNDNESANSKHWEIKTTDKKSIASLAHAPHK